MGHNVRQIHWCGHWPAPMNQNNAVMWGAVVEELRTCAEDHCTTARHCLKCPEVDQLVPHTRLVMMYVYIHVHVWYTLCCCVPVVQRQSQPVCHVHNVYIVVYYLIKAVHNSDYTSYVPLLVIYMSNCFHHVAHILQHCYYCTHVMFCYVLIQLTQLWAWLTDVSDPFSLTLVCPRPPDREWIQVLSPIQRSRQAREAISTVHKYHVYVIATHHKCTM